MIDRWLTNELSRKRWRDFKANRLGAVSLLLLIVIAFFSFTAEFWANNKPIILKYRGEMYWPVVKEVHPSKLGIEDAVVTDYSNLKLSEGDWAVWPVIRWDPFVRNERLSEFPVDQEPAGMP
jgi:microcin C transport system permease protein